MSAGARRCVVAFFMGVGGLAPQFASADLTAARQQALRNLLIQDCGSCHGSTLKGGLGPALTPAALAGKPAVVLQTVILQGRPGTPMPPWAPFMTEPEAAWLVEQLQTGVPNGQCNK